MNEIRDLTKQRNLICQALNLTSVQFANLNRIKGMANKVESLLYTLKATREELAVERSKTKAPNTFQRMSVAMIHPVTNKVIRKFISITEAAAHFGKAPSRLSTAFKFQDETWMGYKWKKIELQKRCRACGKISSQAKFPKNGITEGIQRYKSNCHKCYAKKARKK